ncbi:hypothetical protein BGZ94_004402, partial [Podila epigama]
HPRWVLLGCILFSFMLSSTFFMTQQNWHNSHAHTMDLGREWAWPDMDPAHVLMQLAAEDRLLGGEEDSTENNDNAMDSQGRDKPKTWDVNDPALTLAHFLESPEWQNQRFMPGSDLVNLLRILRPVDHAFYIALFTYHIPGSGSESGSKSNNNNSEVDKGEKKSENEDEHGAVSMTGSQPHSTHLSQDHRVCGPWIQDYIAFQNQVLEKSLPPRYTIHACPKDTLFSPREGDKAQQQQQQPSEQSCNNNVFSQMIAMTSAFAWSVSDTRAFFLRPDQLQNLEQTFQSTLLNQWTAPPKEDGIDVHNIVTVHTEDMSTREVLQLFQLEDDSLLKTVQQPPPPPPQQSRNRVSFTRDLRLGDQLTTTDMAKRIEQIHKNNRIELVLDHHHHLLPQLVNTTRTRNIFLDLGVPLPDRFQRGDNIIIAAPVNARRSYESTDTAISPNLVVRRPSGSSSSSSSSAAATAEAAEARVSSMRPTSNHPYSTAFDAAISDKDDSTRIQAIPKTFGCFLDFLIQPKVELQQMMHPYTTLFQLPAVFSIGIYFQPPPPPPPPPPLSSSTSPAGSSSPLQEGPTTPSVATIQQEQKTLVHRYLTCARQIAREFAPKRKGQKVVFVVVADHDDDGQQHYARFMETLETWDEEVITPQWTLSSKHSTMSSNASTTITSLSRQQLQVMDNWILSKTDYQVVSDHSDFAKVAVWRTRKEGRSIVIRNNMPVPSFSSSSSSSSSSSQDTGSEHAFVDMLDCGDLLRNLIL